MIEMLRASSSKAMSAIDLEQRLRTKTTMGVRDANFDAETLGLMMTRFQCLSGFHSVEY